MRSGWPAKQPSPKKSVAFNGDCGFFASLGDDGQFDLSRLNVKDRIARIALHVYFLLPSNAHDFPAFTDVGKEPLHIEIVFRGWHRRNTDILRPSCVAATTIYGSSCISKVFCRVD